VFVEERKSPAKILAECAKCQEGPATGESQSRSVPLIYSLEKKKTRRKNVERYPSQHEQKL